MQEKKTVKLETATVIPSFRLLNLVKFLLAEKSE